MNLKEILEKELPVEVTAYSNNATYICRHKNKLHRMIVIVYGKLDEYFDTDGDMFWINFDRHNTINGFSKVENLIEALHNYFKM